MSAPVAAAAPAPALSAGRLGVAAAAMGVIVLGSLAGLGVVSDIGTSRLDATGAATFIVILLILWVALFLEILSRPYSMHLANLFAMYILLGISPLYHVMIGRYPMAFFSQVDPAYVVAANTAIILWLIGYLSGYAASAVATRRRVAREPERWLTRTVSGSRVNLGLLIAIPVLIYLASLGLGGAVTRAAARDAFANSEGSVGYVINQVLVRFYPVIATSVALLYLRRNPVLKNLPMVALVGVVGLATTWLANPVAAARYWLAAAAIGFAAPQFLHKRKTGAFMALALLAGLTILPGLGDVRHAEDARELALAFPGLASPVEYLALNADLAEYGFLALTLRWIDANGYTWGLQLLGAIFTWIPRFMWPGKPVSTGTLVSGDMGYEFTNLATPIVSEPLIDFGLIAVPFFAAFIGMILARLDTIYWYPQEGDDRRLRVIDTFYPFMVGLQLLLVRGGLNFAIVTLASVFISTLPMIAGWRSRPPSWARSANAPPARPSSLRAAR